LANHRLAEGIVSTTLRVFVGEHWPERPATHWALVGATGDLLQQGESDALRWPAADFCEAVISAPQVSWLRASIPDRVSRLDLPQVVASALEDRLLDDPEQCQLTPCGRQRGTADVLVISRARLRNVVAQFAALNRPLSAVYSELQSQQALGPERTVTIASEAAVLSRPGDVSLVLDLSAEGDIPPLVEPLVQVPEGASDSAVVVRPEPGKAFDLAKWKAALNTEKVTVGPDYHWYRLDSRAADMLHGEFEPLQRRSGIWLLVKPPLTVAAAALSAYFVVALFQLGSQYYRVSQLDGRIAALFRGTFPDVPIMAPFAQTRRYLDALRASQGLLRSDDALSLLAAVSEVLGADGKDAVRSVTYENRRLTVVFAPSVSPRLDSLRRQLMARGFLVTPGAVAQNSNSPSLIVEPDLTR
jgi:type II secretion system protein L